ncbi:MAG: hypothetical protein KDH96_00620 [Candidatus Riesia sp.]|nr:hypothetical protein [Candidatus Riesia sp.]
MSVLINEKEAILKCECGLVDHLLCLTDLDDGLLEVCVIHQPKTWKHKLALIWNILCGKEAVVYDIVIKSNDIHELSDWVSQKQYKE